MLETIKSIKIIIAENYFQIIDSVTDKFQDYKIREIIQDIRIFLKNKCYKPVVYEYMIKTKTMEFICTISKWIEWAGL